MQNKAKRPCRKHKSLGQGAIEYLLIIGAAILVVAVVIIALSGVLTEGNNSVDKNEISTTGDPLKENLANSMNKYYLPNGTTEYYEYTGMTPTTLQELESISEGVNICLGSDCQDTTIVNNGNILTITSEGGTIPKTDLNKQETISQEICNDLIDNDRDSKKDCLDTDCASESFCETGIELTCTDQFDNDGDELIDCKDNDCDTKNNCEYQTELTCNDTIDNDGDKTIDCEDTDCYNKPGCPTNYTFLAGANDTWEDCTENSISLGDDSSTNVDITPLGWPIKFYDSEYTTLFVCNNGYVFFENKWEEEYGSDWCPYAESHLPISNNLKGIVPFYGDSIDTPIYMCYHEDHLTIRWIWGEYGARDTINDVEAKIYQDGKIVLLYNPPQQEPLDPYHYPSAGISYGDGTNYTYTYYPDSSPYYPSNATLIRQGNN